MKDNHWIYIYIYISYALHSLDCNLADVKYVLIPEQGTEQEVQEPAPEPILENSRYTHT
jgi:hypothetical protein